MRCSYRYCVTEIKKIVSEIEPVTFCKLLWKVFATWTFVNLLILHAKTTFWCNFFEIQYSTKTLIWRLTLPYLTHYFWDFFQFFQTSFNGNIWKFRSTPSSNLPLLILYDWYTQFICSRIFIADSTNL